MNEGPDWFAPKRYGIGAGLPITWQGWVTTGIFTAAIIAVVVLLRRRPIAEVSVIIMLSGIFTLVAARTTRGGWHWRWGEDA